MRCWKHCVPNYGEVNRHKAFTGSKWMKARDDVERLSWAGNCFQIEVLLIQMAPEVTGNVY